jgi:outer membrane protein assembly factor BamA
MYLGSVSAALVYDNSIFGGTSPILGERYRLEVEPTAGTLNFVTLTGDVRKYFRFAPFTLAGRAIHFGRWGGDSEDARLGRLYLGTPSLVRGYTDGSFDIAECTSPGGATGVFQCPIFEQLIGSRIGVLNAELRLPLIGGLGVIPAPGVPPIEVGAFFDMGKAWTSDSDPNCTTAGTCGFSDREWVRSVGFMTRLNLFGFAIAELDFVRPLDRFTFDSVTGEEIARGWLWQFSLTPGF